MLKIQLSITAVCTLLLLAAGMHGLFVESALLRPAQLLTVTLLMASVALYLRLLSVKARLCKSEI